MNILEYAIARKLLGGSGGSSGGDSGGSVVVVSPKAVNFRDYDGTVLHSYTKDEALALTALPELPTQPGLICQEWNWSLEDMQSYVADYGICEVGATYITDDGKTRLYITINDEARMTVPVLFRQSVKSGVTIDWGDGSEVSTEPNWTGGITLSHTYAHAGDYVITLDPSDDCVLGLGGEYSSKGVLREANSVYAYANMLRRVEIGRNVSTINTYAFAEHSLLKHITIPREVKTIGKSAFYDCRGLESVIIPNGLESVESNAFHYCYTLNVVSLPCGCAACSSSAFQAIAPSRLVIPEGVTIISAYCFYDCKGLTTVVIPKSVTEIGGAFYGNKSLKVVDLSKSSTIPALTSSTAFNQIPADCEIRVPAALAEEWKAATNWSTYASKIVGV